MARRARGALAIGAVALLLGVIACSSFGEEGDPEPQLPADDAGIDTTRSDTRPETDAAPDGIVRPCAHTFCDDFDAPPLGAKWTTPLVGAPGYLELAQGNVASPPYALLARFTGQEVGFAGAALRKDLDDPGATTVDCHVKVFIEKLGTGHPTIVQIGVKLAATAPATSTTIDLALKPDLTTLSLFQDPLPGIYPTAQPLARERWLDLLSSVDLVTGEVRVVLDGSPLLGAKLAAPPMPNNGAFFKIGTFDIGSSEEHRILFDDVWCDVK